MVHIHLIRTYHRCRIFTAHMSSQTDEAIQPQRRNSSADTFVFLYDLKLKGAVIADLNADFSYFCDR